MQDVEDTGFEFGGIINIILGTWTKDDGKHNCHWCGRPFRVGQRVQDTLSQPHFMEQKIKPAYHILVHVDGTNRYCDKRRAERNEAIFRIVRAAEGS